MSENLSGPQSKEKSRGWLLPAVKDGGLPAGLYLVATPIGNLGDITLRALDTLARVDGIYCEDTRVSGKLLKHFGIENSLHVYNDHSDARARGKILARIQEGKALALISDAGTPLISDPGYKLVHELRAAGVFVTSIPGANAPLTALQLSGSPSDKFSFIGFLPPKSKARRDVLQSWKAVPGPLIAFETAPRLADALKDIADVLGARNVSVARELTKLHEEVCCDEAAALAAHYQKSGAPKGEIVLVIAPGSAPDYSEEDTRALLIEALKSKGTKEAAAVVAAQTGLPKKMLYTLALTLHEKGK